MSFAFGFTEDSLDDESMKTTSMTTQKKPSLAELSSTIAPENLPKIHTLDELLDTLIAVRITFDNYTTPGQNIIYRRELFDVKHQVMCEDNPTNSSDVLIDGDHDLKKNIYEGGFKSWECSYDVVDKMNSYVDSGYMEKFTQILDMGCGTALPTSFLIMKKFMKKSTNNVCFTLADFNYDVLRLVTLPNILVHWASTLPVERLIELTFKDENPSNDVLVVTPELITEFKEQLAATNTNLRFISGAWGSQFNTLVGDVDFIITSETIYSLDTLPLLAEALVELAEKLQHAHVLVAAKDIYFGVGGSVVEFVRYLESIKREWMVITVEKVQGVLLGRSLIHIERK